MVANHQHNEADGNVDLAKFDSPDPCWHHGCEKPAKHYLTCRSKDCGHCVKDGRRVALMVCAEHSLFCPGCFGEESSLITMTTANSGGCDNASVMSGYQDHVMSLLGANDDARKTKREKFTKLIMKEISNWRNEAMPQLEKAVHEEVFAFFDIRERVSLHLAGDREMEQEDWDSLVAQCMQCSVLRHFRMAALQKEMQFWLGQGSSSSYMKHVASECGFEMEDVSKQVRDFVTHKQHLLETRGATRGEVQQMFEKLQNVEFNPRDPEFLKQKQKLA